MTGLPNPWTVPMVNVDVAGDLLGIDRATVYRLIGRGDLTLPMPGRVSMFSIFVLLGAPIPPRPVAPAVGRR